MKRYIKASAEMSYFDQLYNNYPKYESGMRTYEVGGKTITTNLLARKHPYWNGYSKARGYIDGKYSEWGKLNECFDSLIDEGYTEIKLVCVPTSIHGLTRTYMWYK